MVDLPKIQSVENGDFQKSYIEIAQESVLSLLKEKLPAECSASLIAGGENTYKIERTTEVRFFTIKLCIDTSSSNLDPNKLTEIFSEFTTNDKLREYLDKMLTLGRIIHRALQENNDKVKTLSTPLSLASLYNLINPEISLRDFEFFFEHSSLTSNNINDLLAGKINIVIPIVYKRLAGTPKDQNLHLKKVCIHEIEAYEAYYMADFNTFCAFKLLVSDLNGGVYVFTLQEKNLNLFDSEPNLFSAKINIFGKFMKELSRLHLANLTHGDLHFKNIGYIVKDDGTIIIFFDLIRSTLTADGKMEERIRSDLKIFTNSLKVAIESALPKLTLEDRLYVVEAIGKYLEEIGATQSQSTIGDKIITSKSIKDEIIRDFGEILAILKVK